MRVIGGRSGGRRLAARLPGSVRPTSDRVREAVFGMLESLGAVEQATVVDLFCGSGALGLEALSRGAKEVTFVDSDQRALKAVRANLASVGLSREPTRLVRATLPGWLVQAGPFDLALCDPPYAFSGWQRLLELLVADVAVFESSAEVPLAGSWSLNRLRRYGGTLITVAERSAPAVSEPAS